MRRRRMRWVGGIDWGQRLLLLLLPMMMLGESCCQVVRLGRHGLRDRGD